jgi:ADP-ribose pyrophosphatase YjhB (NUDIX family)
MDTIKECDHKSVGMLVWKNGKLLLIERGRPPYGFALPAGHVDDKGSYENAAREETEEEVGLQVTHLKLLIEGRKDNKCRRPGGTWHYWKIYEAITKGEIKRSPDETKQAGWYTVKEIKVMVAKTEQYLRGKISEKDWISSPGLEPVWLEWLSELKIN